MSLSSGYVLRKVLKEAEIAKVLEGLGCHLEKIEPVGLRYSFLSLGYIMVFRKEGS